MKKIVPFVLVLGVGVVFLCCFIIVKCTWDNDARVVETTYEQELRGD